MVFSLAASPLVKMQLLVFFGEIKSILHRKKIIYPPPSAKWFAVTHANRCTIYIFFVHRFARVPVLQTNNNKDLNEINDVKFNKQQSVHDG